MLWQDVTEVLDALEVASVRHWVAGGWGIDVLVGRQTREHHDLDLAVDLAHHSRCMTTLGALGYAVETDWLPVRIEVAASNERWVDVHPVRFDAQGLGIQGDPAGVHFLYPETAFTEGQLQHRLVPCLSMEQQELFHSGYDLCAKDKHDLELLAALPRWATDLRSADAAAKWGTAS